MKAVGILLVLCSLASAAPIPKNLESKSEAIKRLFGDVIVHDDISFDLLRKSVLSAEIGGQSCKRDLNWNGHFPKLVTKEINGEFETSAKLTLGFEKEAGLSGNYLQKQCCSGLLLMSHDETNSVFFGYFHRKEKKDWQSGLFMMSKSNRGGSSMMTNMTFDEKPYSIRLTRRDGKVSIETAAEGKPFRAFTSTQLAADVVNVSLVHFNTLDAAVTADFEDFVVREASEKK
jgi:hypothetical protein